MNIAPAKKSIKQYGPDCGPSVPYDVAARKGLSDVAQEVLRDVGKVFSALIVMSSIRQHAGVLRRFSDYFELGMKARQSSAEGFLGIPDIICKSAIMVHEYYDMQHMTRSMLKPDIMERVKMTRKL